MVQRVAQTHRVDLPVPFGRLEVGVLCAAHDVAGYLRCVLLCSHAVGHVIAKRIEIHCAAAQQLFVARLHIKVDVITLKVPLCIIRVHALALHVAGHAVAQLILLLGQQNILRAAGERINCDVADHGAKAELRVDLPTQQHSLCAGNELVVQGCVALIRVVHLMAEIFCTVVQDAAVVPVAHCRGQVVDLVEGDPVFYHIFIAAEQHLRKAQIAVDAAAIHPAAHRSDHVQRHLIVIQGDQRLNAVFFQLCKYLIVKLQTRFVGLRLGSFWEDARPVDGHPIHLEAHFCKQRNILFIMVIEIGAAVAGIIVPALVDLKRNAARQLMGAGYHCIGQARAFAVRIPGTFYLIGRRCTAPEKSFGKALTTLFHIKAPF